MIRVINGEIFYRVQPCIIIMRSNTSYIFISLGRGGGCTCDAEPHIIIIIVQVRMHYLDTLFLQTLFQHTGHDDRRPRDRNKNRIYKSVFFNFFFFFLSFFYPYRGTRFVLSQVPKPRTARFHGGRKPETLHRLSEKQTIVL